MDILHLVDRLEETVRKSRRLPFSSIRLVDERRIGALVEQMRISVPEEVRRAQRVNQERERILAQAREEAERGGRGGGARAGGAAAGAARRVLARGATWEGGPPGPGRAGGGSGGPGRRSSGRRN